MRIVVTRPQSDSERTAEALREHGHAVLIAPLLRIESLPVSLHQRYGAVVITSANAAMAIAEHPACAVLAGLPVFAVGKRSADAARAAGFSDIHVAGGDVDDLVRFIAEHRSGGGAPLVYLASEDRSGDLAGDLAKHGIAVELAVIYRAVPVPVSAELVGVLRAGAIDAVLHFSRRSAEAFITGIGAGGVVEPALKLRHFCLSQAVAAPLVSAGIDRIAVAKRPNEQAMIELVGNA